MKRYYIEAGGCWHPVDDYDYSTPPDGWADQQLQELEERLNIYAQSVYQRLMRKEADEHAPRQTNGPPTAPPSDTPD